MSKAKGAATPPTVPNAAPTGMISTQTAVYLLNTKIQKIEEVMKLHMDDIETKFGEHEAYVTDNIPDLDQINKALSDINTRLIDLEGLESRIAALEQSVRSSASSSSTASSSTASSATAPSSPPPLAPPPAPKKKGGTVKLADITPTPVVDLGGPGISFS